MGQIMLSMPGTETAIREAEQHGYEAVVLVVVLFGLLAFFGILGKWFIKSMNKRHEEAYKREERLSTRVTTLELFVETTLVKLVNDCSGLMAKNIESINALTVALGQRICLLDGMKQEALVDRISDRVGEHVADNFRVKGNV
jgi:hypothetical protein